MEAGGVSVRGSDEGCGGEQMNEAMETLSIS